MIPTPKDSTAISSLHVNSSRVWRGGERQTLLLVEGLRVRGHDAAIVCPPGSPLATRARQAKIPTHELPMRNELDLRGIFALRRLLRSLKPQVLQLHTGHAHTIGVIARGFRQQPPIIVNRRVDFSIHRSGTPGFTRLKYALGVDLYIAISSAIERVLISDGIDSNRIQVIHSGVPPLPEVSRSRQDLRAEFGIPPDAIVVGTVGELTPHKGHIHLVRALERMRTREQSVHVVIVGGGKDEKLLAEQAQKSGTDNRLHLVGFQQDVAGWLATFDIFAMPSVEEGLGTSVLDAMRAGLPVVASAVGGIPEAIIDGQSGILVPPRETSLLAEAIDQLIDDPGLARRLAESAQLRVEKHFSAEAMIDGTLEVHRQLLEKEVVR